MKASGSARRRVFTPFREFGQLGQPCRSLFLQVIARRLYVSGITPNDGTKRRRFSTSVGKPSWMAITEWLVFQGAPGSFRDSAKARPKGTLDVANGS